MVSNRLFHWTFAAIACCALGPTRNALAEQPAEEDVAGPKISIVIEEGDRLPSQVLDSVAARELGTVSGEVTFSIVEGRALLAGLDGQVVDAASGGAVAHADIVAGPNYDETIVRMLVDGKPVGRALRVGTITSGSVGQLLSKDVPDGSEALLSQGADYAVVDMDMLRSRQAAEPAEPPAGQYCATILDKERDVYGYSRLLAKACSDRSDEEAFTRVQSQASTSGAGTLYSTYLMTWYEHAGYAGRYENIYGCCGTCDFAGYSVRTNDGYWQTHLSSVRGNATGCNTARYSKWIWFPGYATDWGPARALPDWYVGDYYNDSFHAVKVYRGAY